VSPSLRRSPLIYLSRSLVFRHKLNSSGVSVYNGSLGGQMQTGPQVGWDVLTVDVHYDLITKLTVLFLVVSGVVLFFRAVRSIGPFWRLKTSGAMLRTGRGPSADDSQEISPTIQAAEQQFNNACSVLQIAQISVSRWSRLTLLILLLYSATEFAGLFSLISREKMTGISALSGSVANILNIWTAGLWLLVALSIADWILASRVARCREVRRS